MPIPSADTFAALARSSPWRWSTLRFTVRFRGEYAGPPVRAWLRRPDLLRVETVEGELRQIVREQPRRVAVLTSDAGRLAAPPWSRSGPAPRLRPDGLVAERPDRHFADRTYDDPMYENYRWVAMLDPVELADGFDLETGEPAGSPLTVDAIVELEHGGRPAWQAVARTTPSYEPHCGCCPLLRDREVDTAEWGAEKFAGVDYPTGHLVRLDVGTGVCVWTEALGGTFAGDGHDLRIEAVDEPMADDLFVEPRREFFRGQGGQPAPPSPSPQ